ncbi:MAG: hypothetical protein P4L53_15210 [Candidatus Obscuribacterales bacterium]|nr:hypothetical protein [Candidatus Obscuribacterales bacterium]
MFKSTSTQHHKPKLLLVYLTPLMVFALSFGCEQIFAADAEKNAEKKTAEAKTSFFISTANIVPSNVQPVTSGVKLLEGIFLKLRNQPQLAFGNSRAQNLLQAAINPSIGAKDLSSVSSATDQLLAIRPAERAGRGGRFEYAPNEYAMASPSGRRGGGASASSSKSLIASHVQVKPLAQSVQNLAGAAGALQDLTQNNEPASVKSYGAYGNANHMRSPRQLQIADDRAFTNERGQLVASAPLITEFKNSMSVEDERRVPTDGSQYSTSFAKKTSVTSARAKASMVPPPPPVAVPGNAPSSSGRLNEDVSAAAGSAVATMAPASPGLFRNIREIGKQEKFSNGSGIKEMFDECKLDKADSSDKKQIAMLPPSIVSGVPLVHLGASALQIKESFGTKVKIDKQIIDDWTVWSVTGRNRSECALQLYFKHGVVEAIRVFDASYLGPDLGIKLGNDLQTIKEKFGEPAFILPEPAAARGVEAGKNYIYPISQISFALARSRDRAKPAPQVVSILIFNVK